MRWRRKSQTADVYQYTKGASMNASKTSKRMPMVKIAIASLATLFAALSAGCAAEVPTSGNGVTPAPTISQ